MTREILVLGAGGFVGTHLVSGRNHDPIHEFDDLKSFAFASGSYGFVADIPLDESGKPRVIKIEQDPRRERRPSLPGCQRGLLARTRRRPQCAGRDCPDHTLLAEAEKAFYATLSSYTLADLVRPAAARQVIKAVIASAE